MNRVNRFFSILPMVLLMIITGSCAYARPGISGALSNDSLSASSSATRTDIMTKAIGITCNDINALTAESIALFKDAGISYIRLYIPYPFGADGITPTLDYLGRKHAAQTVIDGGLHLMCQTFTPGGNCYDEKADNVIWRSNLPAVFNDFDDDYFYKATEAATKYIGDDYKDLCDYWLVSNEPDINVFTGSMTLDQIARYLSASAKGLKSGNPDSLIGINMMGTVNRQYSMSIINKICCEGALFSFIGLDGYFGTLMDGSPDSWKDYIDEYSQAVGLPVIITEYSYSSAAYDPSLVHNESGIRYNSPVCRDKKFAFDWAGHERSPETQAGYITACLRVFSEAPSVIGSFWFCSNDYDGPCWECGDCLCPMNSSWGILKADGVPKSSYYAMKEAFKVYYKK